MVNQGNSFNCDVCTLEFTSQAIMDAHLAGSKHQRRVQGNELLWKLQQTETCFTQDEETGKLTCLTCHVELTSPQLLEAHLLGTKHKNKVSGVGGNAGTGGNAAAPKRPADGSEPSPAKKRNPIPGTDKYFCDTCQTSCNSDAQWDQHLNSKKHLNKLANPGQ